MVQASLMRNSSWSGCRAALPSGMFSAASRPVEPLRISQSITILPAISTAPPARAGLPPTARQRPQARTTRRRAHRLIARLSVSRRFSTTAADVPPGSKPTGRTSRPHTSGDPPSCSRRSRERDHAWWNLRIACGFSELAEAEGHTVGVSLSAFAPALVVPELCILA